MDTQFDYNEEGLTRALFLLKNGHNPSREPRPLPNSLPERGLGGATVLDWLAPHVIGGAAQLGGVKSMANMGPPTPWITWATTLWSAALNQNLLNPSTAPVARRVEQRTIDWLAPFFGMTGGHMLPSSTLANLTALWAARQCAQIYTVVAADTSHVSIIKAAQILGLKLKLVQSARCGRLLPNTLPRDLSHCGLNSNRLHRSPQPGRSSSLDSLRRRMGRAAEI